jgi:tRNA(adenine34) deaminase
MPAMNYELHMSAALAEARTAASRGERPDGAVAVLDQAMVAGGHEQVRGTGDPTAHAVVVTLREAAQRLATTSLQGLTIFCALEPCVMCVGALLTSDVDGLVFAIPDPVAGAAGSVVQLTQGDRVGPRLHVVSGILQADATDLVSAVFAGQAGSGRSRSR